MLRTAERIVSVFDLQQNPDSVIQNARRQPIVVTAEGRPAVYIVSVEAFDELLERMLELERQELIANVAMAERQFCTGDYLTLKEAVQAAETRWQAVGSTTTALPERSARR